MQADTSCRIAVPQMLLIGAAGRNLGKTELAVRLVEAYAKSYSVVGIKVVTLRNEGDVCPRGDAGCGICQGLEGSFDIKEETGTGEKDTMRLKQAGAKKVYLVRACPEYLKEAMARVLSYIPEDNVIICESNSVATVLKPSAFLLIGQNGEWKPSALSVRSLADEIVEPKEEEWERLAEIYGPDGKGRIGSRELI